ncbi:MAG: hypothetical protein A3F43_03740 [Gammaproteobacteria bacterium RIFCSPHIGHO2_12_FULL_42_10]|nr:MAG: hypothetical protein A3F43_03740 [Gammaproteobacteria bacterium RIFCSPHIGHO2_12_FULL_42_10]
MINKRSCKESALALLLRRDYATQELIQKLKYKGYLADNINQVMDELARIGYLQDERYTANLIEKYRRKGIGPRRVLIELTKRGISEELIEKFLQDTDLVWQISAHTAWTKRFKGQKSQHRLERGKQIRFLQYRGFTDEQIKKVVNEMSEG